MYDLVSRLIYLGNFSEKKTSKTSLGKEIPISPKLSSYFRAFLALLWGGRGDDSTPTGIPPPGEASVQLALPRVRSPPGVSN